MLQCPQCQKAFPVTLPLEEEREMLCPHCGCYLLVLVTDKEEEEC